MDTPEFETKFAPGATPDDRRRVQRVLTDICQHAEGRALVESTVRDHGILFRVEDNPMTHTIPPHPVAGCYYAGDGLNVLNRGLSDTNLHLTTFHELGHNRFDMVYGIPRRFYGIEGRVMQLMAENAVIAWELEEAVRRHVLTKQDLILREHCANFNVNAALDPGFKAEREHVIEDFLTARGDPLELTQARRRAMKLYYRYLMPTDSFYYKLYIEEFVRQDTPADRPQFENPQDLLACLERLNTDDRFRINTLYNTVSHHPALRSHHIMPLGEPLVHDRGGNCVIPDKGWLARQFDAGDMPQDGVLKSEALQNFNDFRRWRDNFVYIYRMAKEHAL